MARGGVWTETSTNFGTPICDVANCGTGGGTGPAAGVYWAWFGGITVPEIATLSQSVVIGSGGPATLTFQLEMPSCESSADWFYVEVDGTQVYFTDGADPACNQIGYQLVTLNLNAYADGLSHTITFVGDTVSFITATNFMVDQIALMACP